MPDSFSTRPGGTKDASVKTEKRRRPLQIEADMMSGGFDERAGMIEFALHVVDMRGTGRIMCFVDVVNGKACPGVRVTATKPRKYPK